VAVDVVTVKDEAIPGGRSGNPDGVAGTRGNGGGDPEGAEVPAVPDSENHFDITRDHPLSELRDARNNAADLPEVKDNDAAKRLIAEGGKNVDKLLRLKGPTREKLTEGLSKGNGGSGNNGGIGTGSEGGNGPGVGPGSGNSDPNKRAKRSLRWTLIFNTRDGQDYKRQLLAFGAILAIPDPKNPPDGYLLINDLKNPRAAAGDVGKIERLYWIDDKPSSVHSLAGALSIAQPSHFIVFFPREFEEKLLRLELGYRNKKEDEITETRFEVRFRNGTYEPFVISQR